MVETQRQPDQGRFADYLDYFGLSADPFDDHDGSYFTGGQRHATFSQILHLCQFSTSVIAVIGEAGVGKTALKRALVDHLDQRDLICEVDVSILTSIDQVLEQVVRQFGIAAIDGSQDNSCSLVADAIKNFVQSTDSGNQLKILLVENAHNLDDRALSVLFELARAQAQIHRQLHLLLFAEPQLSQRLQQLASGKTLLKQFALQPMTREEMKSYLRFRLNAVGFEGIFPFKEEDLRFLWDMSHGLPRALHDAARACLIEMAAPPPESRSIGLPAGHMALVVALLAVLLGALFYRGGMQETAPPVVDSGDGPSDLSQTQITSNNSAALQTPATAQSATPVDGVGAAVEAPDVGSERKELDQLLANLAEAELTDLEGAATTGGTVVTKTDNGKSALVEQVLEDAPTPPIAASPPAVPTLDPAANQARPLSSDERRLMALAPEQYTLQVLVSGSKTAVDAYLLRQPNREDLAVFVSERNGRTVYIVVAGRFQSSQAARAAVTGLPDEQRRAGPWPRTVESVQADIRRYRGNLP